MKKIALIMESWKRFFTYAWPAGILQRIHETNEDVNLYIFNSSDGWTKDEEYKMGEYNIFRLPDLKDFDGVVLDLNNISNHSTHMEVIEKVRAAKIPVISVANEIDGCYYVGIDNYAAMRKMISHLHKEHGCEKFWFVMGPPDNYETMQRAASLIDYVKEHNLPYSEDDIYYENYEYQCGVHGFQQLMERHNQIPDAIICCNDNIAVGACEAAAKLGYHVPDDFCVTGFDDFDKASYYMPCITTIGHIREDVGYLCADLFIRLWAGEKVPQYNYTETQAFFRESCGCQKVAISNPREYIKDQLLYGIESDGFNEDVLSLDYELLKCNTVEDMMACIPQCIPAMRCDALYLVMDKHMNAFKHPEETGFHQRIFTSDGFLTEGYPDTMQVMFAYENGKVTDITGTEIEYIFPMFDYSESGTDFLFLPLHFRSYTVGYLVIRNAVYLMEKQYLFQVSKAITTAMENLHKKEKLEYMNNVLSDLYIKDAMTDMYNRLGYQRLSAISFTEAMDNQKALCILFLDVDRLKYINDTFGHSYGDFAIITASKAIQKYCGEGSIPCRTGGDEFVVILPDSSISGLDALIENIRAELYATAQDMNLPFELSISIGFSITDPASGRSFEDYVKEADDMMYKEKCAKKVQRTS